MINVNEVKKNVDANIKKNADKTNVNVPVKTLNKKEVQTGLKAKQISQKEIEDKIKQRTENLNISEKYKKVKSFIYLFQLSENFKKLNELEKEKESKANRMKFRRSLERTVSNALLEFKKFYSLKVSKSKDALNESIKEYVQFVNDTYIVNDCLSTINYLSLEDKKQKFIFDLIESIKDEISLKNEFVINLLKKSESNKK